ncbi:hypothetical protein PLEOSDRAFT_1104010 [Pleurotus ostreatus PC15]|uniref:Uncharacterized protein n=1 Tax=Pleurotus ostreatus (strain PC15) TaxID=1137138 RepID=A0A067NHM8_PLEO1|nr:hypothetical protein PLEOSDRAFT_1104010 [Pleurotus ostreatus PC15]
MAYRCRHLPLPPNPSTPAVVVVVARTAKYAPGINISTRIPPLASLFDAPRMRLQRAHGHHIEIKMAHKSTYRSPSPHCSLRLLLFIPIFVFRPISTQLLSVVLTSSAASFSTVTINVAAAADAHLDQHGRVSPFLSSFVPRLAFVLVLLCLVFLHLPILHSGTPPSFLVPRIPAPPVADLSHHTPSPSPSPAQSHRPRNPTASQQTRERLSIYCLPARLPASPFRAQSADAPFVHDQLFVFSAQGKRATEEGSKKAE